MNAVDLTNAYANQRVFVPSDADGKFWNLWNWLFIPACVAWTLWAGTVTEIRWWGVVAVYYVMIMGVTLGFHRYFAHASFKTNRAVQLVLALAGVISGQTGPISWELIHRDHHRNCEVEGDPHSIHGGFWYAHGWFLWASWPRVTDFTRSRWSRYPEIVFLERWAPGLYYVFGLTILATLGFTAAVWYWLVPTFLSWNATMLINSWAHTWGAYDFKDFHQPEACKARNLAWATPVLLGDNWHNNHHAYPNSAFQGFYRWQLDPNGLVIRALCGVGLAWDPILPTARVLGKNRVHPDRPLPPIATDGNVSAS